VRRTKNKSYLAVAGVVLGAAAALGLAGSLRAQAGGDFSISQSVISNGGGETQVAGNLQATGTIGQAAAGNELSGGSFSAAGGFWQTGPLPSPTPTATATASPTATASASATPTATASPSATGNPTATPTASPTPTIAPSATPSASPRGTPGAAQSLNISTRLKVDTGDKLMIAGFIIRGTQSKPVLLRGIGPSLSAFGIQGVLLDPVLELRDSNISLMTNDDWVDSPQRSEFEGGPFQPGDNRESVVVGILAAGNYTALLTGKNNTAGVGVVEAYDLDQAVDAALANISTRGFVQTGENVMIGGFILGGGTNNTRIAVRGIGPSLAQFGLNPVLADPSLELHDANGATLLANDDWLDDPASAALLTANGLALQDPKESGIFTALPPGQFTAILAGKNGEIGIGLVEIYNLQ
jgi:hypothetical protein